MRSHDILSGRRLSQRVAGLFAALCNSDSSAGASWTWRSSRTVAKGRFPLRAEPRRRTRHPDATHHRRGRILLVRGQREKLVLVCDAASPSTQSQRRRGRSTTKVCFRVQNAIPDARSGLHFTKVSAEGQQYRRLPLPSLTECSPWRRTFEGGKNTIRRQESQDGGLSACHRSHSRDLRHHARSSKSKRST